MGHVIRDVHIYDDGLQFNLANNRDDVAVIHGDHLIHHNRDDDAAVIHGDHLVQHNPHDDTEVMHRDHLLFLQHRNKDDLPISYRGVPNQYRSLPQL
jgi:hypothetical protein